MVGDKALASLDNPEAKELVARMKAEQANGKTRFCDRTISEYFKVFAQVIASAKDDKAKLLYSRSWNSAYTCLPMVCQREQHRPTLDRKKSKPSSPSASGSLLLTSLHRDLAKACAGGRRWQIRCVERRQRRTMRQVQIGMSG